MYIKKYNHKLHYQNTLPQIIIHIWSSGILLSNYYPPLPPSSPELTLPKSMRVRGKYHHQYFVFISRERDRDDDVSRELWPIQFLGMWMCGSYTNCIKINFNKNKQIMIKKVSSRSPLGTLITAWVQHLMGGRLTLRNLSLGPLKSSSRSHWGNLMT